MLCKVCPKCFAKYAQNALQSMPKVLFKTWAFSETWGRTFWLGTTYYDLEPVVCDMTLIKAVV